MAFQPSSCESSSGPVDSEVPGLEPSFESSFCHCLVLTHVPVPWLSQFRSSSLKTAGLSPDTGAYSFRLSFISCSNHEWLDILRLSSHCKNLPILYLLSGLWLHGSLYLAASFFLRLLISIRFRGLARTTLLSFGKFWHPVLFREKCKPMGLLIVDC